MAGEELSLFFLQGANTFPEDVYLIVYFSQARLQGPRCELVEEEGPRGADEHSGEQAVQDVQRLRLRLLQRQRTTHRGQQVQGLSALADDLVVSSSRSCKK